MQAGGGGSDGSGDGAGDGAVQAEGGGKYKDIDGAAGILEVAGMTYAACVLRPVSVGAGAGIEGDD